MTPLGGLSLPEAEAKLMEAHPGFRVYHDTGGEHGAGEYATVGNEATFADMGLPLWAPDVLRIEELIAWWERRNGWTPRRTA